MAILKFFGMILSFFSNITGGYYLFGLFIFAFLIKIILLPFGIKQQKTSIKQAKMRPKEMAIRKKYAGRTDRVTQQKMQNEIMELYQREGYSPMSGCLPLLIQMPIILILYQVIINPLKYICGWTSAQISNITATLSGAGIDGFPAKIVRDIDLIQYLTPDRLSDINNALTASELGTVDFADIPNFAMGSFDLSKMPTLTSILILVPILTFVIQFFSMKLTRKFSYQPMAQNQQQGAGKTTMIVMDLMMPAITTVIAFKVPAAIGIYWAFNNILGVLQQVILSKAMPLPRFTEEDFKAAELELKGRAPKNETNENRGPVRSLHTIDFTEEEVDADLGDYVSVYDKPKEENDNPTSEVSEKKKKLFGKSKIKNDEKPSKGNKE